MIEKQEADVETAKEPHSLAPLEAHLNGSQHNASAAIKALENWFKAEFDKLRAELSSKEEEEQQ